MSALGVTACASHPEALPLQLTETSLVGEPAPALEPVEPRLLEGDLSSLLAAFAVPNDPTWLGPCTAIGVFVPVV